MLERAVRRRRSLPAESLCGMQSGRPLLEPLSTLSRMVALISHDLRHPLSAILANAEFLSQAEISPTQRNDFYEEIRSAVEGMNELLSSLLECSTGRETLRPAIRNIVETIHRLLRRTSVRPEL